MVLNKRMIDGLVDKVLQEPSKYGRKTQAGNIKLNSYLIRHHFEKYDLSRDDSRRIRAVAEQKLKDK